MPAKGILFPEAPSDAGACLGGKSSVPKFKTTFLPLGLGLQRPKHLHVGKQRKQSVGDHKCSLLRCVCLYWKWHSRLYFPAQVHTGSSLSPTETNKANDWRQKPKHIQCTPMVAQMAQLNQVQTRIQGRGLLCPVLPFLHYIEAQGRSSKEEFYKRTNCWLTQSGSRFVFRLQYMSFAGEHYVFSTFFSFTLNRMVLMRMQRNTSEELVNKQQSNTFDNFNNSAGNTQNSFCFISKIAWNCSHAR